MSTADSDRQHIDDIEARLRDPRTVRRAFEEVIALFSRQLYWQIRRLVDSHDDANDILQNTFLKAWSNIENFRGEAKISTWLNKIAINESLSHIERRKRRYTLPIEEAAQITADEQIDGDALSRELRNAVNALPDKQKLVFNMKYFDDMKYEEISDILGTSVGALKASYYAAVKKIEQHFNNLN